MKKLFSILWFFSLMSWGIIHNCYSQTTIHGDWYQVWAQQAVLNKGSDGGRMPPPTTLDLAQRLSYEPGRYLLPAFVYASQIDAIERAFSGRTQEYLDDFNNKHNSYLIAITIGM